MSQKEFENYEYEARAMISESIYKSLTEKFFFSDINKKALVNINTYFDNDSLFLSNNHMVLRIREVNENERELTLKIKGEKGDIEINHSLTSYEYKNMMEKSIVPASNVKNKLVELGLSLSEVKMIVTLKTERLEVHYPKYTFVIDKNYFRDKVDYNVEVESSSKRRAIHHLNKEMKDFKIKYKKGYISKSRRAIFDL